MVLLDKLCAFICLEEREPVKQSLVAKTIRRGITANTVSLKGLEMTASTISSLYHQASVLFPNNPFKGGAIHGKVWRRSLDS